MFLIELVVPFLVFCGRRARQIACGALILLMLLISITGNYCFFNLLTVALCVLLLDDAFLLRLAPAALAAFVREGVSSVTAAPLREGLGVWTTIRAVGVGVLAVVIALVSGTETADRLAPCSRLPAPSLGLLRLVSPLRTINSYGLFAVMTTSRPEIVVAG